MTHPQQHDDPLGESRGQVLQALAVLTTVGEAAARFAVAGAHNRAAKAERQAKAAQLSGASREHADTLTASARAERDKAARRFMDKAFDQEWLDQAGMTEVAELWRTAAMYAASGDARARQAMRHAEDRLHQLDPVLMDAYARHRAAGMNLADAMRAAANDAWQHHRKNTYAARPHGNSGSPPAALTPPPRAIGATPDAEGVRLVDELEAATRAEVARLADGVSPELLDRLQRQWRSAGHAPAADAATLLADAARLLRAEGQLGGPITGTVHVRRGVNHSLYGAHDVVGHDTVDVPVQTASAGHELVAQGLDRAADTIRAHQAAERHMAGLAEQQRRAGLVDQGASDLPGTPADEHRDGVESGRRRLGIADHDRAAAEQQSRLARAFRPLDAIYPTLSGGLGPNSPSIAPRKGRTR